MAGTLLHGLKQLSDDARSIVRREVEYYKALPRVATLFITYRCNSRCKTCNMWQRPQDAEIEKEIGLSAWKQIIDKLVASGVKEVEPFGGNALLRKELLIDLLGYMHEKGMTIHLPTNQLGLDDPLIEAIVNYVDYLYLSNDGLGSDQDYVRGIEGVSQVSNRSVEKILDCRQHTNHRVNPVKVICNCTVSRFNCETLEPIADYALQKGFDEVDFEYAGEFSREEVDASKIMGYIPDAQYIRQGDSILVSLEEAYKVKESLARIKEKYRNKPIAVQTINIDSLSVENLYMGTIPYRKCYIVRREVTADPYGNLIPCPFMNNILLGNLVEEDFDEVWNGSKHQQFLKLQGKGTTPMCKSCILGVQRNPDLFKSVERVYLSRIRGRI